MVSVAMAVYNGEKYIKRQIDSILVNLSTDDELIVSDDGSTDRTLSIIAEINDSRVKVINGPQRGLVYNFANAIDKCEGDYIFLSDQDDYWHPNKVERVKEAFEKNDCVLIEHNCNVLDDERNILYPDFFVHRKVRSGYIKNVLRNTYHGCLIAFKKELKAKLKPFPKKGCLHDQWIGLCAEKNGGCIFLDEKLMEYYRHQGNASSFSRLSFAKQFVNRFWLIAHIIKYKVVHLFSKEI